jgi:hypothetical protein
MQFLLDVSANLGRPAQLVNAIPTVQIVLRQVFAVVFAGVFALLKTDN